MVLKNTAGILLFPGFLALLAALSACTLQKPPVYIPPEYSSPPPTTGYTAPPPPSAPSYPPGQQSPPPQGPAIISPPEFRKQELPPSPAPAPAPQPSARQQAVSPEEPQTQSPRHLASMQFVNEARNPLNRGKPDLAIPMIEQAIQSDPQNGEAFLLLARAWRQKGAKKRALEFAKKAELLYQDEPAGLKQVLVLESDLYREMGDKKKASECRRRARGVK